MNFEYGPPKIEQKEKREFTIEDIRQLLKTIDGKERHTLVIEEEIKNIKGELTSIIFTDNEIEDGSEVSYLLTLPGQRYKKDGTPGNLGEETLLTKDYDGGIYSKKLAEYREGKWIDLTKIS